MKKNIILYENQRLYLDSIHFFLDQNIITKKYNILEITNFDKIEKHVLEEGSILILNPGGLNIIDIIKKVENLLQLNPSLKIIIHSVNPDIKVIKKLFDKGVKSYLGHDTGSNEFIQALNKVIDGHVYINDDIKNALLSFICNKEEKAEVKHLGLDDLTLREKDVLILICDGLCSKEIAEKLFISTNTVESHRRNMMFKLNINRSSQLIKFAMENKLVEY